MRPSVTRHVVDESYLFPHSSAQAWKNYFGAIHGHGNSWAGIFIAIRMQVLKALINALWVLFPGTIWHSTLFSTCMTLFIIYDTIKYHVSITYWLYKSYFAENRTIRYVIAMRLAEVFISIPWKLNGLQTTVRRCSADNDNADIAILMIKWWVAIYSGHYVGELAARRMKIELYRLVYFISKARRKVDRVRKKNVW